MKVNKNLFEKRFDLKNNQVNGGSDSSSCMSHCEIRTGTASTSDVQHTYYNDNGSVRSVRTVYNLSNSLE